MVVMTSLILLKSRVFSQATVNIVVCAADKSNI